MEPIQNCIPDRRQINIELDPEIETLNSEATTLLTRAKAVIVSTPEDYVAAGAQYAAIKGQIKLVEAERVKRTGPLNESLRLINADFKRITETLQAAMHPYEQGMLAYKQEEDRKHREAEAAAKAERDRLEAEARANAAEEKARLQEAKRKEQEAQQAASAAEAEANPIAAFLAREEAAKAAAETEAARQATEDALRDAAMAPRQVVSAAAPRVMAAGTSYRTTWKFEIVDFSLIPREYLIANEQMLGAIARSAKGKTVIPGVRFIEEKKIGGR